MRHRRTQSRSGFTLIELIAALGSATVVLVALGSMVMVAGQAVPDADDETTAGVSAWGAADRFAHDLATATDCSGNNPWTLTLPDRDGDGSPETVVWDWDSTGADKSFALCRIENGGTPVVVLARAKDVDLDETEDGPDPVAVTVTVIADDSAGTRAVVTTPVWNLTK
ncbi:MAG: prepilin-type N-terminal cleavage/methylation domain-containing protein [Planctomycetota bacterium]